jgi:hypothetical protein
MDAKKPDAGDDGNTTFLLGLPAADASSGFDQGERTEETLAEGHPRLREEHRRSPRPSAEIPQTPLAKRSPGESARWRRRDRQGVE